MEGEPRAVRLTDDSAVVAYRAAAKRAGGAGFKAAMSSVYVRRGGEWLLAFHHQTQVG